MYSAHLRLHGFTCEHAFYRGRTKRGRRDISVFFVQNSFHQNRRLPLPLTRYCAQELFSCTGWQMSSLGNFGEQINSNFASNTWQCTKTHFLFFCSHIEERDNSCMKQMTVLTKLHITCQCIYTWHASSLFEGSVVSSNLFLAIRQTCLASLDL